MDEELVTIEIGLENLVANTDIENAAMELRGYLVFLEQNILPSREISGDYARENKCKGEIEGVKYAVKVLSSHCGVDYTIDKAEKPDKEENN